MIFFIGFGKYAFGQKADGMLKGKVSFITSKNIYVKFENTEIIKIGDTLRTMDTKSPCLLINNKSSNSIVSSLLNNCIIKKGDEVYYNYALKAFKTPTEKKIQDTILVLKDDPVKKKQSPYSEMIKGRVSASSYSTLSDIRDDRHRLASRFSLYADHIGDSKFSFSSYANYQKDILPDSPIKNTTAREKGILRVYDFAARFDADPTLSFVVGRNINQKISSVGAIDGIQAEKHFGKNYIGVIAGFRPDIFDYRFNSNLFEYGAYYGKIINTKNFQSETTLGGLEQRNNGEIDRRYAYFQHSSTIYKKIHLFSSLELDLYDKINNIESNTLRLTNLFTSLRYRFNRDINATISYDSRKRILYYETFQSEIERLLNDDIARQGIRIRLNVRPTDYVYAGISYSKRFQNDQQNKSDNIYIRLGISKIPGIGGRISVNYNINTSNYLNSNILSLRHSRDFFNGKLYADFYYRLVNYTYLSSNVGLESSSLTQSYYGTNLSYHLSRRLTFSISGELSTTNLENNYRIYTRLTKRFYSKRKKRNLN